ncbi:MAG: hypothetical protein MK008_10430 [Bdellovibrionales bacterium]|nr:hypothetical protein [Bdellovibrionales bacterium]
MRVQKRFIIMFLLLFVTTFVIGGYLIRLNHLSESLQNDYENLLKISQEGINEEVQINYQIDTMLLTGVILQRKCPSNLPAILSLLYISS